MEKFINDNLDPSSSDESDKSDRVAKNLPVLELLNHFIIPSTVAYKQVAYKKHVV